MSEQHEYSPGALRASIFIQKSIRETINRQFARAGLKVADMPDEKAWASSFANDIAALIDAETQAPELLRLLDLNAKAFEFLLAYPANVSSEILDPTSTLCDGMRTAVTAIELLIAKINTGR